jgi:hypothetical protein
MYAPRLETRKLSDWWRSFQRLEWGAVISRFRRPNRRGRDTHPGGIDELVFAADAIGILKGAPDGPPGAQTTRRSR